MPLDPRLLRVGVQIAGSIRWYTDVQIAVSITKFANPTQNEATVKITNMAKDARDYILTNSTPFNLLRIRKKIYVEAGRVSTGYFRVFEGDIWTATISQPPDIMLTMTCKTNQWDKGVIVATSYAGQVPAHTIAAGVASSLGLDLDYQADPINISNYNHTGSTIKQVDKLGDMGRVNAYVDDNKLVVKNFNKPLKNVNHVLSMETGMIGIPELTEQGFKATCLLNPNIRLGGNLTVKSTLNPAASASFCVFKLTYELTNRDVAFYVIAEGKRYGLLL